MEAAPLVVVDEVGIDMNDQVNIEVDFDHDEAREILGFMARYNIPTYADAVRLLAMVGAGTTMVDPTGASTRLALKLCAIAVCFVTGAFIDHDTGW